ncbi:hypothetical protein H5410_048807 [Solanum commersonii]|uniref:Uncharacterized protein n=1 Tax=Solanum commersonii TaxID=4109 RepID=A0A9J5XKN0_SOLCO|nr:hypothetical protein H5410_048807 [Solanum commersonii]
MAPLTPLTRKIEKCHLRKQLNNPTNKYNPGRKFNPQTPISNNTNNRTFNSIFGQNPKSSHDPSRLSFRNPTKKARGRVAVFENKQY